MGYVYRYICPARGAWTVYIGKVTSLRYSTGLSALKERDREHKIKDKWRKDYSPLILQYIETISDADADIFETWLISYYQQTGQLQNDSKTRWGTSELDLSDHFFGKWKEFGSDLLADNTLQGPLLTDAQNPTYRTLDVLKRESFQRFLDLEKDKIHEFKYAEWGWHSFTSLPPCNGVYNVRLGKYERHDTLLYIRHHFRLGSNMRIAEDVRMWQTNPRGCRICW